jgi:hypothetical protein
MKEVSPGAPPFLASLHHVFRVSIAQSKSHNHIYRFNRSRVDSQMIINPVSNPPTMLTARDQLAMAARQSWLVIPSSDPHPVARPDLQHLLREAMAEIEGLEHWPSSQS